MDKTQKSGPHSKCLSYTLKMRVKFAGRRRERAELNNYRNCVSGLCSLSTTFFDDVAKQQEHSLKTVWAKDQQKKRIRLNSRGEARRVDGVRVIDSIELLRGYADSFQAHVGGDYSANLNLRVTALLSHGRSLWGDELTLTRV